MEVAVFVDEINKALDDYPLDQKPAELYHPIEYLLTLDSSRFYSLLTLWSCYLFSGDHHKAITPSLGVEIFFNFLMVHSDLLDSKTERRGKQSVHVKWNQNVAILSGDAMVFKAYEMLIQVDPEQIKPVVRNFNRCFTKICEGKQLALNHPKKHDDPDVLLLNPGALGEFSMWLGSLIAETSEEQQQQAGKLGTTIAVNHAANQPLLPASSHGSHATIQALASLNCDDARKSEFEQWLSSHF